jgi:ABC-2 type transport system permease protein
VTLTGYALRRMRNQILAFGLGLAVWGGMYVFLFPVVQEAMGNVEYPQEILAAFGASGGDISDPRVFYDIEFFSLAPSISAVFAVIAGTAALAGEESAGTMDFLAALPFTRRRLFEAKALAVAAGTVLVAAITSLAWIVPMPFAELAGDLTVRDLIGATFLQVPFLLLIGAIAMLLGAVAPSRSAAAAWTGAFVIAAYLLVAFASVTDRVESLRYASPYYYTDLPGILEKGLHLDHQVVLWTMIAACYAVGRRAYEGRELSSERWQWQALLGARTGDLMADTPTQTPTPRMRRLPAHRSPALYLAVIAVVGLAIGFVAAGGGGLLGNTRPRTITVSGRIDADGAMLVAPTTGPVHIVLATRGDEVKQGQVIGWVTSAADASEQPIVAPLAGTLTDLTIERDQSLVVGAPIGEVRQLGSLRAVVEVDEQNVDTIAVGQPVDVTVKTLGLHIATQVSSISPVPVSEVGTGRTKPKYEVRCPLPNPDQRLAVGMRVDARIDRRP